ncbi:MAG: restriction endonuclease [Cyanobacteria bacterium J06629_9]
MQFDKQPACQSPQRQDGFHMPVWVNNYRPKRLKRPNAGRIFQVPRKRKAMRDARVILQRLRRDYGQLPLTQRTPVKLAILRCICPFVFEELLLHSCTDHGYRVARSCYTHDGGIDGAFYPWEGARFLIQAKRYAQEIDPEDLLKFVGVVHREQAAGGVFMHTGLTCSDSRFIEDNCRDIMILSGEDLVAFLWNEGDCGLVAA